MPQMHRWYCLRLCKGSSTKGDFAPKTHPVTSGNISGSHNWGQGELPASRGRNPAMLTGQAPTANTVQSYVGS